MPVLYSYIVRYDSGFAPNPFYGFCTLATCKPRIRKHATIGDWIIGTGSNQKKVRRGGFLVYAMRVQETMTFADYWSDLRFARKKPDLYGSYCMACGDNIYCPDPARDNWAQLNSYHSQNDGTPSQEHIDKDTSVNRVLISRDFVYFGAEGPKIPEAIKDGLVCKGIEIRKTTNITEIEIFESWMDSLGLDGYQGKPFDMIEKTLERK